MRKRSVALVFLAACGGGSDDAAIDAAVSPDAGPPNLDVLVQSFPGTSAVETVIVADPSGAVRETQRTDDAHHASVHVEPGDSVTARYGSPFAAKALQTIYVAQPGESIVMGASLFTPSGTFHVSFPAASGTPTYALAGPCGAVSTGTATEVDLPLFTECEAAANELFVITLDGTQYLEAGVNVAGGGSYTFTGPWQSTTGPTTSATYTSIPNDVTQITAMVTIPVPRGYGSGLGQQPNGASLTLSPFSPGSGQISMSSQIDRTSGATQTVELPFDAAQAYSLDVSTVLPSMAAPTVDPAAGTLMIDSVGDADTYQGGLAYGDVEWDLLAPAAGTWHLPQLPSDLAPLPTASDSVIVRSAAHRLGGVGYGRVRGNPAAVIWDIGSFERQGDGIVSTTSICVGCPS